MKFTKEELLGIVKRFGKMKELITLLEEYDTCYLILNARHGLIINTSTALSSVDFIEMQLGTLTKADI